MNASLQVEYFPCISFFLLQNAHQHLIHYVDLIEARSHRDNRAADTSIEELSKNASTERNDTNDNRELGQDPLDSTNHNRVKRCCDEMTEECIVQSDDGSIEGNRHDHQPSTPVELEPIHSNERGQEFSNDASPVPATNHSSSVYRSSSHVNIPKCHRSDGSASSTSSFILGNTNHIIPNNEEPGDKNDFDVVNLSRQNVEHTSFVIEHQEGILDDIFAQYYQTQQH